MKDRSNSIHNQCAFSQLNNIFVRMRDAPMIAKGIQRIENGSKRRQNPSNLTVMLAQRLQCRMLGAKGLVCLSESGAIWQQDPRFSTNGLQV